MTKSTLCGLVALALVGCDGGGGGTDAGGGGTDGGARDGGGGGMTVDVVFEVHDGRLTGPALSGVAIAVDLGDGTRVEGTTDAMGRATFAVDWSAGPIDVTLFAPGHAGFSTTEVTEAIFAPFMRDGVVPFALSSNAPPRTDLVTLSGRVTGGDPGHRYQVTANVEGATLYNNAGPDYTIDVPPGVPFRLTVLDYTFVSRGTNDYTQELVAMGTVDVDAISADTTLDLDLTANPVTLTEVSGSVTASFGDAIFYALVGDLEGVDDFYGAMTSVVPTAGGVDYSLAYWEDPAARMPYTRYFTNDDPEFSQVTILGWPTASPTIDFLPPPAIVTPAFGETHPIHDTFALGRVEPGVETAVTIYDLAQDDRVLWNVVNTSGGEMVTPPALPSAVNRADVFPASAELYARPYVCARMPGMQFCQRFAVGGRAFDLVP